MIKQENEGRDTKYANTFRLGYTETEFFVDFGLIKPEKKEQVDLVTSVSFPTEKMQYLIVQLFRAALDYEEEFDKDIGFKKAFKNKEDSDD